ncbi:hypothetical protein D9M68_566230 [compost metagenome]
MMLDSIELDDQLEWADEFEWDAVAQERERTITGHLVVQEGVKVHGRPITLRSNGGAWTALSVVRQLEVLRDLVSKVMQLVLPDGREFYVMWRRAEGEPPLEAVPVFREVNPPPDADMEVTLRFFTVAPPLPPDPEP